MREYLEQQLKKKAHELVMIAYRVMSRVKGNKSAVYSLRQIISRIPVSIFEGQDRQFDEDKIRYFSNARNSIFESRYYLDLIYGSKSMSYYSYRQIASRLDLLDKMLVSRIQSVDKRKARTQFKVSIREKYL